jgi:Ca2+-transporting ATPase
VLFGWPLVLLPAHIVFLEFIIDPVCSIAFEAEREERDAMKRPPRSPAERLFSWRIWMVSLLQGLAVLTAVTVALLLARGRGASEAGTRALAFATLVGGNLALVLSNRSWSRSLFATLREPNRAMALILGVAVAVLALTLYVPPLARLFRFEGLGGRDFTFVGAAAVFCLLCGEGFKRLRAAPRPTLKEPSSASGP